MHRLLPALILAAACSAPPETAEPPAEATDPELPALPPILAQNAFLYYSDLAEAEAFYRDTLGLPLALRFRVRENLPGRGVRLPDARGRGRGDAQR